jgi:hypothetical protein
MKCQQQTPNLEEEWVMEGFLMIKVLVYIILLHGIMTLVVREEMVAFKLSKPV